MNRLSQTVHLSGQRSEANLCQNMAVPGLKCIIQYDTLFP